ncbi:MAG: amidohydrolase [Gammaproteobacteria bacterium]|nr:MAG: amidohydrolase [Gammaproteobacteria bacterium]
MQNLTVAVVQQEIVPNNPQLNLSTFSRAISHLDNCDLIVLPEVFTTGFCANARSFAELVDGTAYTWMAEHAKQLNAVITGSLVVKEGDTYFNRMVWMCPDGSYTHYDKRHLFRMGGEHTRYQSGTERLIVELNGWRILPLVCYDLRFPVWSRNRNDYDLSLYVANWPSARALHWNRLLQARAIENQSYVVGVNRVGMDEVHQHYSGDSAIYGPAGEVIVHSQETGSFFAELYGDKLLEYREKFPAYMDADEFELKV